MPYEDNEKGCKAPQSSLQQLRFDPKTSERGQPAKQRAAVTAGYPAGPRRPPAGTAPRPEGGPRRASRSPQLDFNPNRSTHLPLGCFIFSVWCCRLPPLRQPPDYLITCKALE